MTDNDYEIIQHCINTDEYLTIKVLDRYLLFHDNILCSQLDLDLPSPFIRKIFHSNFLAIENAQISSHVNSSLYDLIVFPDKSIVYTHKRISTTDENHVKILPYYVKEDLELLEKIGMTKEEIDLFVQKLDAKDEKEIFKDDRIIQKIIDFTDIPTRLKCRQVSRKWQNLVDKSTSWKYMKLSINCRFIDRALDYFQNTDIRELDLSEALFEPFDLKKNIHIYSLRSLCISTDHPLELFTLLFQIAPFLQHITLIQTYNSSLKFKTNNQLYDCINFVISQCQLKLKCLRRLHIQLRSISDQIFLQSSSTTSIPVSYEIITC